MFHDIGLTPAHSIAHERFEVDSANAARDFLCGPGGNFRSVIGGSAWSGRPARVRPGDVMLENI
jgi:hypothetical protein